MAAHRQAAQDPGDRLRLIAAASVAALAVVLPLAAVTADHHDAAPRRQAGHSTPRDAPDASRTGGSADGSAGGSARGD
ncbi:hypothetical protein [Streptomyces sp. NPDC021020]|uniref:hypothetical protein n=1 Tax=Streptomyces sp. NPDC021020 TaxID=3365109 RepID=UPI0037AF4721